MNPKWNDLIGCIALIIIVSLVAVTPALAAEYIDVETAIGGASLNPDSDWQQTFTPTANNITAVSIFIKDDATANVTIQILDIVCGNVLAHGTGSGEDWVKCDLVGAQAVVPGNIYVIKVISDSWIGANGGYDAYSGGACFFECNLWEFGGEDLTFRTWAEDQAVPTTETSWSGIKSLYR